MSQFVPREVVQGPFKWCKGQVNGARDRRAGPAQFITDLGQLKAAGITPFMFADGGLCNPSWFERLATSSLLAGQVSEFDVNHAQVTNGLDVAVGITKGIISMNNPRYARESFLPPAGDGPSDGVANALLPAPYLRRSFRADEPVAWARLHVTALGLYEARLNGERAGDYVLAPGWTDYARRIPYQTYDVTGLLRPGENVFGAIVADGRGRYIDLTPPELLATAYWGTRRGADGVDR